MPLYLTYLEFHSVHFALNSNMILELEYSLRMIWYDKNDVMFIINYK